jgi:ABC-2 type transport system ATP-binding protein
MLQIQQLEKIIDSRRVLAIEHLEIQAGEIVALVGPGGSGKTLLIQLLCGQIQPSRGQIFLEGQDMAKVPMARCRLGVLFADDLLYERLTVQGNLEFFCHLHGLPNKRVGEVLALVGMSDQAQKRVNKLSWAEQRRLAFARTLLNHPTLLLLDDPLRHTNVDTQQVMQRIISDQASQGTGILLALEDLAWAGKFCTRIVEIEAGRIIGMRTREMTISSSSDSQEKEDIPALPQAPLASSRFTPFKIPARKEDRIMLYDPNELLYATSRDGKTYLRTTNDEAATNLTLQELEQRLVGRGFFKAHRAYLVNLQHIRAVIQFTRNSYTLLLGDDKETMIPLSKQCEKELQELLGY